jgi:hypothetical protein
MDTFEELITESISRIRAEIAHLVKSGAVDPAEPYFYKAVLCVALHNVADNFRPFTPEGREAVANLKRF